MSADPHPQGILATIAGHLALAMQPLRAAVADLGAFKTFMYRLGWRVQSLPPAYSSLGVRVDEIATSLATFQASPADPDPDLVLGLFDKVQALYQAIQGLTEAPVGVDPGAFLTEIGERLFELLLVDYLAAALPAVYHALSTVGVIAIEASAADGERPARLRARLRYDRVRDIISDPTQIPRFVYGWGDDDLDTTTLLSHLRELLDHTGALTSFGRAPRSLVDSYLGPGAARSALKLTALETTVGDTPVELAFVLLPLPAEGALKPGLILQPVVPAGLGVDQEFGGSLRLQIRPSADLSQLFGIVIRPGDVSVRYPFAPGTELPPVGFGLVLSYKPEGSTLLLGRPAASRLEMQGVSASIDLDNHEGGLEVRGGVSIDGLMLVLAAGDLDGFLGSLIGDRDASMAIALGIQWSSRTGVAFTGAAGLELSLNPHLTIGPLSIQELRFALRTTIAPDQPADLILEAGASFGGHIGPVEVAVANVGLQFEARFESGNAGPFNVSTGVKSPDGVGIVIDAQGVLTGGGFIYHDPVKQLYAGALQLSLHERITLTAFGLIATKMPDGSRGYSMIVFITAEGFQPIQLGMGFTLNGIGGMVAIHRTFDEDVLRAGLKSDTLGTLLFPRDPVGNAPALIAALAAAFPAKQGSYLLGLLVRIGWGTPTLVLLDLGLILEFGVRTRLLVLGRISALLPSPDNDLVRLILDSMGVIDFDQGTASIDAVLVDSRLAHKFALTGAMALRARWSSGPGSGFILAVGGVNPHFSPPEGLPVLQRLGLALSSGDNPRLTCDAYFAITSNTVQFGAHAQLYAAAYGFSVEGDIGFDVLIQIAPLHFIADFNAKVQLKHGSSNLFMVSIDGELEGPRPLRVSGKASFSIFWCDFTVRFDKTLVDGEAPPPPPAIDVLAQLKAALSSPQSWTAQRAPGHTQGVALRAVPSGSTQLVLDPLGRLLVKQQVVPLNTGRDIENFGGAPVSGARRFQLAATLNAATQHTEAVQDQFAPALFFELSDDEKLAAPSFETMDAGLVFGDEAVSFDATQLIAAPLQYQQIVIDDLAAPPPPPEAPKQSYVLRADKLIALSGSGAAARAPIRTAGLARFRAADAQAGAVLQAPDWRIVPIADGLPAALEPTVRTWTEHLAALDMLNRRAATWQIVPAHELTD